MDQMDEVRRVGQMVRQAADRMDTAGRAALIYEVTRAVYDAEKFSGRNGGGLDGRDSAARDAFGEVADVAGRVHTDVVLRLHGHQPYE